MSPAILRPIGRSQLQPTISRPIVADLSLLYDDEIDNEANDYGLAMGPAVS